MRKYERTGTSLHEWINDPWRRGVVRVVSRGFPYGSLLVPFVCIYFSWLEHSSMWLQPSTAGGGVVFGRVSEGVIRSTHFVAHNKNDKNKTKIRTQAMTLRHGNKPSALKSLQTMRISLMAILHQSVANLFDDYWTRFTHLVLLFDYILQPMRSS